MKLFSHKSGSTGLIVTVIGGAMLAVTFVIAFDVYQVYFGLAQSDLNSSAANFMPSLNSLLQAAIVVMFLGIMGWVGSAFLLRGVDFMKVDRGVGVVTFKVDKGAGIVSGVDVTGKQNQTQVLEVPADH
ncbi:MAG TPA: hypothetical protein VN739_06115 [Nitrososphaerales archaeon]|nr:hypothetical protein [Nitrososphaerales archaeon]